LRRTLCLSKHSDEEPGDFLHRCNTKLLWFRESFGWISLVDTVKTYVVGWAGHVARLRADSPLKLLLEWRSRPSACGTGPRVTRARTGPEIAWDDSVVSHIGLDWTAMAQSRALWSQLCGHGLSSWRAKRDRVPVYSEKVLRLCRGKRCPWGFRLAVLEENSAAVRLCNGEKAAASLGWDIAGAARAVQWYLHLLEGANIRPALGERFAHDCARRDAVLVDGTVSSSFTHQAGEVFVIHCRVRDGCMCMCTGVLRMGVWTEVARELCTVPSQAAILTALESILHGICHFAGYLLDRGLLE
jgi:hypothetical protein